MWSLLDQIKDLCQEAHSITFVIDREQRQRSPALYALLNQLVDMGFIHYLKSRDDVTLYLLGMGIYSQFAPHMNLQRVSEDDPHPLLQLAALAARLQPSKDRGLELVGQDLQR